jgi:exosome complex RNA-binding protein Rrp42 (RNase PH superfamily)
MSSVQVLLGDLPFFTSGFRTTLLRYGEPGAKIPLHLTRWVFGGGMIALSFWQLLVDLNYDEDSTADLDMNVVMTQTGKFLEIQGTAERHSFSKEQVLEIMDAAQSALQSVFELQIQAVEGQIAES